MSDARPESPCGRRGRVARKLLVSGGACKPRRFASGPELTASAMVERVAALSGDWSYDTVSVGVPAPVHAGHVVAEPVNLGSGWVGFDFEAAFDKLTKVVNDAAMQALGSYEGGKMLFLGLGTGLGGEGRTTTPSSARSVSGIRRCPP